MGHVERYNPVVTELCKLVRHEKILALEVRRYSPYNGRITDADVVQDLMVHDIDLVCNVLMGRKLVDMFSAGEVVPTDHSYILADLLNRSLSLQRNTNLVIDEGKESAYRQDSVTQKIFVPMVEPLRMELIDFVDHVMSGTEPAANGSAACRFIRFGKRDLTSRSGCDGQLRLCGRENGGGF